MEELTVTAVVKGGLGLARGGAGTVLVRGALPGEIVVVAPEGRHGGSPVAGVERVVAASPDRREAPCPLYARCGGCDLQHATYEAQGRIKLAILQDCLARVGRVELPVAIRYVPSPELGYRRRVRLHVAAIAGRRVLGYYRRHSRDVEPLESCPLLTPGLGELVTRLAGEGAGLLEGAKEISILEGDDGHSVAIEGDGRIAARVGLREELRAIGVVELAMSVDRGGFRPSDDGVRIDVPRGASPLSLRASARAFFQGNAPLLAALVAEVVDPLPARLAAAWDLHAGVGLFAAALAGRARALHAVESDPQAAPLLARNLPRGARAFEGTEVEFLRRQDRAPDVVIADPPRTGLSRQARDLLARLRVPRVVLVGCDPAAFALDLGALVRSGMRVTSLALLDLYPQSSHVEAVAHLQR